MDTVQQQVIVNVFEDYLTRNPQDTEAVKTYFNIKRQGMSPLMKKLHEEVKTEAKVSLRRRWTPHEDALIQEQRLQGTTWRKIGQMLGRSKVACRVRLYELRQVTP